MTIRPDSAVLFQAAILVQVAGLDKGVQVRESRVRNRTAGQEVSDASGRERRELECHPSRSGAWRANERPLASTSRIVKREQNTIGKASGTWNPAPAVLCRESAHEPP